MKKRLILKNLSSSQLIPILEEWSPASNEDVYICLDMEIGFSGQGDRINLFYVTLATPESLRRYIVGPCLAKNRTILISEYSYQIVMNIILEILDDCTRETFEESCTVLQRYFSWEYEDYSM